jgi:hypothetical protein
MPRCYGRTGLGADKVAAEIEKLFDNEVDSDSDETIAELNKQTSDPKYVKIDALDGLVCKRGYGSVATLRVSRAVSFYAGHLKISTNGRTIICLNCN